MTKKEFLRPGKVIKIVIPNYWDHMILYETDTDSSLQESIDNYKPYYLRNNINNWRYCDFLIKVPLLITETGIYKTHLPKETILVKVLVGDRIELIKSDEKISFRDTVNSIEVL